MSWSFNVLLTGETPHLNWLLRPMEGGGLPLAGGYRGVLCQARGDWAWYCEIFFFPQWNEAVNMCWMCMASNKIAHLTYTDCTEGANWRHTYFAHESFMQRLRALGYAIPILFLCVIGFRFECVVVDVLHTVEQGIGSHIVGNVLWTFGVLRNMFGGNTYAQRVARMDTHMRAWYRANRIPDKLQGPLTVERLRSSKEWPKLKAKAAQTRQLARYALTLVREFGDDSMMDTLALGVCTCLVRFYEVLNEHTMVFPQDIHDEMPILGQKLAYM